MVRDRGLTKALGQKGRCHGVAYCPHCDGPLFKGKPVAVIGGGNSGIEAAIDLANIVEHVTVLEFADTLRADEVLIRKANSLKNITIIKNAQTTEVLGDGNKVIGLNYTDRVSGESKELVLAGIFVQIGAGALCKEAGAKRALPLPVSVPSHCALMKPAADKLAVALEALEFNAPALPVINNVDVIAETDPAKIKDALVRQLYNPVRWTEGVQAMNEQGVEKLLELGPGKVLTGLTKRIVKTMTAAAVNDTASLEAAK